MKYIIYICALEGTGAQNASVPFAFLRKEAVYRREIQMKILCLGDVVGRAALESLAGQLARIRKDAGADMIIINGENAAMGKGNGMTKEDAEILFAAGADVITGGNHSFRQKNIYEMLDDHPYLLRPANYPGGNPGKGHTVFPANGRNVLVINVSGRVHMDVCGCPFETCRRILAEEQGNYDIAVVDFHAEATGEKLALAYDLDGKVNCFFGTHTHVPTADWRILPQGTGYITDVGMCGPVDSALGLSKDIIINQLKTGMPAKYQPAPHPAAFDGVLFTLSDFDHRCTAVERVQYC